MIFGVIGLGLTDTEVSGSQIHDADWSRSPENDGLERATWSMQSSECSSICTVHGVCRIPIYTTTRVKLQMLDNRLSAEFFFII